MSVGPLIADILCVFLLSVYLLHKYGDWRKQHLLVTLTTFVSWYFCLVIVFMIPLDVSSTFYRQCLEEHKKSTPTDVASLSSTTNAPSSANGTLSPAATPSNVIVTNKSTTPSRNISSRAIRGVEPLSETPCEQPWSYVPENILPDIWQIIYWTTFVLTWVIMPIMKSYSNAGDFTVRGKLKSALIENAIWYGSYLLIFGVLLIYVAANPHLKIDGEKLQIIGITASNTWGLFLLVLLLGYGLVEVPRKYWAESKKGFLLSYTYFQLAKFSTEKSEAEEHLEDILEDIRRASDGVRYNHPLRQHVNTIIDKCPTTFQDSLTKHLDDFQDYDSKSTMLLPSEKELIRLHKKVIFALQAKKRTDTQWDVLLDKAYQLEDIQQNENDHKKEFQHSFEPDYSGLSQYICTPSLEWYWKIWMMPTCLKVFAIFLAVFSFMVVWSEVTFFSTDPVLSIFAVFIDAAARNYNYLCLEVLCCIIIAYLCWCSYYTVFKIRVFNYYYLSPHHQTDENSLLFCGMMLCRLTPPLCLNFLGLIHLDGHVTGKQDLLETSYTSIMGRHLDVLPFMEKGFYIYYPITVVLLCVATYFHLGSRCLSFLGFQQFVGDEDMTTDLIDEGKELVRRDRRRKQRAIDSENRKKSFKEKFHIKDEQENGQGPVRGTRFGRNRGSDSDTSRASSASSARVKYTKRDHDDSRVELLRDSEPIDYNEDSMSEFTDDLREPSSKPKPITGRTTRGWHSDTGRDFSGKPKPRGFFDDV